ncbi:MAG: leucine-rich repeat domain-containing protein [Clostridia bacterium]|nr:leucine-rich repeat domain-containing protein [Clostridia bacterium]
MKSLFKFLLIISIISTILLLCSCNQEKSCEHQFSEWETVLEPTCLNTGLSISQCAVCQLSKTTILEKAEHIGQVIPSTEPTCQEKGLTEGTICSVCNKILQEQDDISKVNHKFQDELCIFCNQQYYSKGLNFSLNNDEKSYSVSKGSCSSTDIVIPSVYNELPVTSIITFKNSSFMESIIIPDSVISIESGAFYGCSSLEKITVPFTGASPDATGSSASLGFIFGTSKFTDSYEASQYYNGLFVKDYYIPNSLKEIVYTGASLDYGCFSNCTSLEKVSFTNNITTIPDYSFYGCTELKQLPISDNTVTIGNYAFSKCASVSEITISQNLIAIGDFALFGCSSLSSILVHPDNEFYKSSYGNLYSKDGTSIIQYSPANPATTFSIPETVTRIEGYAFHSAKNLEHIEILGNVNYIGESAFRVCSSLKAFDIPNGVENIFDATFLGCTSLTEITFGSSLKYVGTYSFQNCASLTNIRLPNTVTAIGKYAFSKCSSLELIYIPKSVISIEEKILWASSKAIVHCGAKVEPSSGWDEDWNYYSNTVFWNKL